MRKKWMTVILAEILLYLVQFWLIPLIARKYIYSRGNERMFLFAITTIVIIGIAIHLSHAQLQFWLLGVLFYALLLWIYSPPGAYDIGMVGLNLDGMSSRYDPDARGLGVLIWSGFALLLQLATWSVLRLFWFFRDRR